MLAKAAAMFVAFATMVALQLARCRLLFLSQMRAIAGSTHSVLRLLDALERR